MFIASVTPILLPLLSGCGTCRDLQLSSRMDSDSQNTWGGGGRGRLSAEETSMQGKERSKRLLDQKQQEGRILLLVCKWAQWTSEEGRVASQLGRPYDPTVETRICGKV
jgi:hypothetical protein